MPVALRIKSIVSPFCLQLLSPCTLSAKHEIATKKRYEHRWFAIGNIPTLEGSVGQLILSIFKQNNYRPMEVIVVDGGLKIPNLTLTRPACAPRLIIVFKDLKV